MLKFFSPFLAKAVIGSANKLIARTKEIIVRVRILFLYCRSSREVDRFSGVIMPLRRLRCKIRAPDFLTRRRNFQFPQNAQIRARFQRL